MHARTAKRKLTYLLRNFLNKCSGIGGDRCHFDFRWLSPLCQAVSSSSFFLATSMAELNQAPSVPTTPFQRKGRSQVRKFFTRDVEGRKAKCLLCEAVLTYDGCSTSNLQRHLSSQHPFSLSVKQSTTPTSSQSILKFTQAKASTKPISVGRSTEITKVLSRWTWLEGRPVS